MDNSNKIFVCSGLQSYFVDITPKKDCTLSIDKISEFFYEMKVPSVSCLSSGSIRILTVGLDLSAMIADIEHSIGRYAYISHVDIGPEIVVYDSISKSY